MTTQTYTATCHCGAVALDLKPTHALGEAQRCDCSYCRRRAAAMVSVLLDDLQVTRGADKLKLYTFNTHTAKHHFCSVCGIYMYHQRRSDPRVYGVNLYTIEGTQPKEMEPLKWGDGVNHSSDQ